jgi:hypothetical protein
MKRKNFLSSMSRLSAALVTLSVLAGCGGGGGGNASDVVPQSDFPVTPFAGPDSYLIFPNPQVMADGKKQTVEEEYATAYYTAIDPTNAKDTLAKWKAANQFDSGTGTQVTVVFGDQRDLGYGRRMTVRQNTDGTLAFVVENYLVRTGPDYGYSNLNLEAAIVRDSRHFIGINAIEFSPGPNGGVSFGKWFNFSSTTGQRQTMVDLDGRGDKAMPGPCISCHGGRGDALAAVGADGKRKFTLVQNTVSQTRGDVEAHLHPFEPDVFGFSTTAGFTRADQEAAIKTINRMILCSYPLPAPSSAPEDACRRPASPSEWQGTAASLIKESYGGDGLPNATFKDEFVPQGWVTAGQSTLYKTVVAPACRTCHIMRGNAGNSDLDFTSYAKFAAYSDRIKHHVLDRGNMPLAKIVYDAFYTTTGPANLANFLEAQGHVARSNGALLKAGRPIADPGPSRVVRPGTVALTASRSLYANAYAWSLVSGPAGAALAGATTQNATLTANTPGNYVVQLVVSNAGVQSDPVRITVVASATLSPAPEAIRFADIKSMLQASTCTNCHSATGTLPRPPVYYTNTDRNGDGTVGDATDDRFFYEEVRSRINFIDLQASALLRKPSGNHHGGNLIPRFNAALEPGNAGRQDFDLVQNWILNGAPY